MKFTRPIKDVWYITVGFRAWYFLGRHTGIDLRTKCPKHPDGIGTPVYACANGEWVQSKVEQGYGLNVIIKHSEGFTSRYAHLSKSVFKPGYIKVKQGDIIGYSGSSTGGSNTSTGPHLHWEVKQNGKLVNPLNYL